MQVDTHAHVIADDEETYPLDPLPDAGDWYRAAPHTVEQLLRCMDDARVDRAVLVQAVGAYQCDNRYVLDAARRHRDRCVAVVCTDLQAPDAADDLRRLIQSSGVRGLRWWALGKESLTEPRAVWNVCAAAKVPVVITMFAQRLEELLTVVPRLPPVPIAIDHCAFADYTHGIPEVMRALGRLPGEQGATVHWKVSTITLDAMEAAGDMRDGLGELADRVGGDRILWGSDFSQTHDRPYGELAEQARRAASRLGDDARAGFLCVNALGLWPDLG